jgi:hypothetical protein
MLHIAIVVLRAVILASMLIFASCSLGIANIEMMIESLGYLFLLLGELPANYM